MEFISFDNERIWYTMWEADRPKATIQVVTGLAETSEYYDEFGRFMSQAGYTVVMHEFRKHAHSQAAYGEGNLFRNLARDCAQMCDVIRQMNQDRGTSLPVILFAHSIGTTVTQLAIWEKMQTWDGIIYTGPSHEVLLPSQKGPLLAKAEECIQKYGPDAENHLIYKEVFAKLNEPFAAENSSFSFIVSDPKKRRMLRALPYTNPPYTNRFFKDFVVLQADLAYHETLENTADSLKDTPIMFLTGEQDVTACNGTYGDVQAGLLRDRGCRDVRSIVYPDMRHSILQEPGCRIVLEDVRDWMDEHYGRQADLDAGLYLCATPIGNLGDITARVLSTLQSVDLIAAEDTRNTLRLLNHFSIKKPLTSYHEYNKYDKAEELIARMRAGASIALVTDAGTPAISDPGEVLVARCMEEGIAVTSLPGACALITALTLSGLSARRFVFEGFLPADKKERRHILDDLRTQERTTILYEAPHHLRGTLAALYEALGERRITLCRELTKRYEEAVPTTLSAAIAYYEEHDPRGEYVLVMEGADRKALEEEKQRAYDDMELEEHMAVYTDRGMTRKEAMKKVAADRGLSKRDVYRMLVEGQEPS